MAHGQGFVGGDLERESGEVKVSDKANSTGAGSVRGEIQLRRSLWSTHLKKADDH